MSKTIRFKSVDNSTEAHRQESLRIVGHLVHWDQWISLIAVAGIFLFHEGWYSVILWLVILLGAGLALIFRLTRPDGSL
jgi:hypothetical protein